MPGAKLARSLVDARRVRVGYPLKSTGGYDCNVDVRAVAERPIALSGGNAKAKFGRTDNDDAFLRGLKLPRNPSL